MKKLDAFEQDILKAYEKSELESIAPSEVSLYKFKAAAATTSMKNKKSWLLLLRRVF